VADAQSGSSSSPGRRSWSLRFRISPGGPGDVNDTAALLFFFRYGGVGAVIAVVVGSQGAIIGEKREPRSSQTRLAQAVLSNSRYTRAGSRC